MAETQAPKVVLAIDGSEHSVRALQFYIEHLHRNGNVVHLVHALEYPYLPSQPFIRAEIVKELFDNARDEGAKAEEAVKTILDEKKIEYKAHTEFINPGEHICKVAQDEGALMICMGTRGQGTIRRTIMGSVSDYVVHHAHCPVMIARI